MPLSRYEAAELIEGSCRAALADLGISEVATRPCLALDEALATADKDAFSVTFESTPTCADLPLPPCMSANTTLQPKICAARVAITAVDGASDQDRATAKAFETGVGHARLVHAVIDAYTEATGPILNRLNDLAPPCADELVTQLSDALTRLHELLKDSIQLYARLDQFVK